MIGLTAKLRGVLPRVRRHSTSRDNLPDGAAILCGACARHEHTCMCHAQMARAQVRLCSAERGCLIKATVIVDAAGLSLATLRHMAVIKAAAQVGLSTTPEPEPAPGVRACACRLTCRRPTYHHGSPCLITTGPCLSKAPCLIKAGLRCRWARRTILKGHTRCSSSTRRASSARYGPYLRLCCPRPPEPRYVPATARPPTT